MQDTYTLETIAAARGSDVYSNDGDKIGVVEEIFTDTDSGQPEWIGIGTGFLRTKRVLVPLVGAELRGDGVYVPYSKDQVKDSPDIDDEQISESLERDLYSYYGVPHSDHRSDTTLPEGGPTTTAGTTDEASVTRSEEEMRVGTREVTAGRVRLQKWVETEPVAADVTLRQETATIEREPIDQVVSDGALGAEEVEVELRAEEPVVEKETVAKERIGIRKDVDETTETVSGELRGEQVDIDDTAGR